MLLDWNDLWNRSSSGPMGWPQLQIIRLLHLMRHLVTVVPIRRHNVRLSLPVAQIPLACARVKIESTRLQPPSPLLPTCSFCHSPWAASPHSSANCLTWSGTPWLRVLHASMESQHWCCQNCLVSSGTHSYQDCSARWPRQGPRTHCMDYIHSLDDGGYPDTVSILIVVC